VGALLALVGLGAALLAGGRAVRPSLPRLDPLASDVAAAALAGFAYWVVHGSFDWFWEFAGLGAPAFALLGLACALAPSRLAAPVPVPQGMVAAGVTAPPGDPGAGPAGRRLFSPRRLGLAAAAVLALAVAVSLTAPWLSQLQVQSAARIWTKSPQKAYARLKDAARLNPLSDEANLVAGSIALRYGELARADEEFSLALGRSHFDAYATLERGAIASSSGHRAAALTLLERASRLDPREPLTSQALLEVRDGRRVNVQELNRLILLGARQL
jgi:tetratricopeptide (TPR) repeat protein